MEKMPSYQGPDPEKIRSMFAKVAGKYDLANSVLSAGVHHLWRRKLVQLAQIQKGQKILDCATGTGDLAIALAKATGPQGQVQGTDFCVEMLDSAPSKARNQGVTVEFSQADVMALPFVDQQFDVATISFGIRNVSDPVQGLREMARVVKPGGLVLVLEFGQVTWPGLASIYNFYSTKILPQIGGLVTGQGSAYEYLQTSSQKFPSGESFLHLMQQTGLLSDLEAFPLTFGVASIYRARRMGGAK